VNILITIVHVIVCIVLILVVLLQAGKGANMGAVFGGSSQTIFGSSGPGTFLGKMTTAVAIIFMLTSFSLSYTASRKGSSLMEGAAKTAPQTAPAQVPLQPAPGAPAAQSGPIQVDIPVQQPGSAPPAAPAAPAAPPAAK
jgi:preprotein translocase subunit SecG